MVIVFNQNQRLRINGREYQVTGMIAYAQENWRWKEYTLRDTSGRLAWLYVETDQGETEYTLYTKCRFSGKMNDISITYNGRVYNRYESGVAMVTGYFGPEDVDINERVRFSDYRNEESETYLSIEDWDGEKEYTYGEELDENDIVILSEGDANASNYHSSYGGSNGTSKKKGSALSSIIMWAAIVAVIAGIWLGISGSRTPIEDYLKSDSNYQYVTSITNNTNNKKARVYTTELTVDSAVDDIIKAIPNSIESVLQASDEDDTDEDTTDLDTSNGVGILGKNEYAFVYTSENGQTYIQVSGNSFMDGQSESYRSSSHSGYYYNTYRRRRSHTTYSTILRSARQSSTYSRSSSGGGTSSGK